MHVVVMTTGDNAILPLPNNITHFNLHYSIFQIQQQLHVIQLINTAQQYTGKNKLLYYSDTKMGSVVVRTGSL